MAGSIALVSLGTTAGLREADAQLAALIESAGVTCRLVPVEVGAGRALRRQVTATDVVEALASRRAARTAIVRDASAVILSTTTAGLLPRPSQPYAIRFDTPAHVNRPGVSGAWQRAAERRSLAAARVLLPYGEAGAAAAAAVAPGVPMIVVPFAVDGEVLAAAAELATGTTGGFTRAGAHLSVAYAANPSKRGLDLLCAAWAEVGGKGRQLVVTGIPRDQALHFLQRRGVPEPEGVDWTGMLTRDRWLQLLHRADVVVNASRREDYGQVPLEALAAGAPLVTVPAHGAYEALDHARRLAPALVATEVSAPALAAAWQAGLVLVSADRERYAARASTLLEPYRRESVLRVVREKVLPALGVR